MKKRGRSAYLLESLEARLLFSADLAPLPVDGGASGPEVESDLEISLRPDNGGFQDAETDEHLRKEIIFVDENVDDYQQLIFDIESQLENYRQFEVAALDSEHDGIAQISAYLNHHQDVDAVHIISHGADGEVTLGNSRLNSTTLDGYAEAIEGWQRSLSSDADLLFYGCNLAAGNEGQDLINSLTLLTGADVAASDDPTGNAKLGGDWVLEYDQGKIETAVATSSETQQNWDSVLATFAVNTTADTVDANPGDGLAQDASGNTSLRAAIMEANALGGPNEIILNAGTYTLLLGPASEDANLGGDLDVTSELTITGAGAATTVIDANSLDRVFHVKDDTAKLTLKDLTIQGGLIDDKGGGIYVDHNLAQLTAERVIITGNIADNGAGIYNDGTMTLTDVVISNNGDATTNEGGGIHNGEVAILERITISGNRADKNGGKGGGIHHDNSAGSLSLKNVTVSGNTAEDQGGGLQTQTLVTIVNSTFTLNSATSGGGISHNGGTVDIKNTIVAENSASSDPDVEGTFNSQGYNLIGDNGTASGFTDGVNGDQVGTSGSPVDPVLDSLKDNGGFTPTHALLAGSPAIDAGDNSVGLTEDQRGVARPFDGDGDATATVDIGAFEYTTSSLGAIDEFLVNDGYETGSQETSGDVDHSQRAVALADDGSYVVVWSSDGQDAFGWGVYAQRFDKLGNELTGEILVNEIESGNEQWARVVSDSNGNFVVTWTSGHAGSIDVYARRFDSTGAALGGEFRVNTTTANDQQDSSIAMDASGNFVVVWEGYDPVDSAAVFYRRFYANGTAMDATEMRANIMDDGTERNASVAMNATGDFVVVWEEGGHIKFQMFASDGTPGTASTVYIDTVSSNPDVAMDAIGNFVVVYRWNGASGRGIWGHQFDNTGTEQPPWFRVGPGNNTVNKDHNNPSITMDDLGNFIVTYESTAEGGPGETVFAARFQSDKTSLGEFQVNQTTAGDQHMASIAMLDLDNYVVAFTGDDVDQTGVFARQYGTAVFNNAPTATNLTTTSAYNEGDASVAITDIVVSDVDTAETITATLTLNDTSTGSLSANDGATYDGGTGEWTITDTVANVNTALAGLVFTPNVNNDVDTTISVDIDDGDEDGSGPLTGTITLDVTPANDAPTATNLTTTSAYNEGDASVAITDIVVSDVDTAETITATLTLNDTSTGSLSANDGATYDGGTGEWTITDTVANVNTALAGLVFTPNVNNDVDTTISVDIDDGDEDGSGPLTGTITLDVTPANDAPTATNLTTTSAYNEGDASVAITDIVVSDVDTAETITATLTLNDTSTGSLSANDGATYDGGTGEWTITDTVANVNTALAGLVFTPNVNNDVDTTISVDIDDGDEDGSGPLTGTITLDVTPANDAPTATNLTTTSAYNEGDASVAITDIVVSDVDTAETITATLTLNDTSTGSLSANDGATYDGGTGEWTITDTVANVNTALAGLVFTPNVNNDVDTTISVDIDDGDEDGSGPLTGTITLDVTPANDAPTATNLTTTSAYNEGDASVAITDIVVSDVDTAETITATLTLNDTSTGSLSANDGATYDGGTGEWTITDTVANVNTALAGLVFTPNVNNDVDTTISVDIDDGDEDGSGPLTGTITLDVTPANNPPVAVDDNLNATEDNSITFASATALLGNDSDIDGDTPTMTGTTQPANGLLVDNGDGTLTYTPNSNFQGIDSFTYSIGDGNGGTATARAMIVVSPVGDTPQVTNVSTFSDVQSGLIFIDRHASDGSEVTHFKISGITNGTLYFADGVTQINNGVYITVAQGQAGVRFTPADNSTADGSFNVESSEDGVSVASQSGMATSIITLLAPASPPSDPDPGPPPEDPVEEVSEEDVPEESEVAEDAAAETGFPADTNNMIAVKPTQSLMAPNTAKPSLDSGVSNFSRADFDRHNDKTPNGSIHLSPQKLKMLFETKNLGELKAALGKLDITTLSPADYELVRGSLDAIKEEMGQEIMLGKTVLGSAIATSVGLSAGYVVWMLKGGSLLASVLSSLPAWQLADPLAILVGKKDEDGDDDESLETIIEDGSGRDGDKDSKASEPQNVKKESKQR